MFFTSESFRIIQSYTPAGIIHECNKLTQQREATSRRRRRGWERGEITPFTCRTGREVIKKVWSID